MTTSINIIDNLINTIDTMAEEKQQSVPSQIDPCSFANNNEVKSKQIHLNLSVNFDKKVLFGNVDLTFECITNGDEQVSSIILDSRELDIKSIYITNDKEKKLKYSLLAGNDKVPTFGQPLKIELSSPLKSKEEIQISIEYSTSPKAEAIQWLTPEQTVGKKLPYLFTQCQAIGARTLLPCQDTPSAKCPYTANITVNNKDLVALMSALPNGDNKSDGKDIITYKFKQPIPCCSYLIALVVGNIERRDIGKRCAVYCEPSMIEAAAFEFGNTEKMLEEAEKICGEFVWGRYDLLMLPPSFPC